MISKSLGPCFFEAAKRDDVEELSSLLKSGAEINVTDRNGWTALHFSVSTGSINATAFLLENKISVDAKSSEGATALHIAAGHSNSKAKVEMLLQHRANVVERDASGATPLHWAGFFGRLGIFKLLVEAGASVTATNDAGETPLQFAKGRGHIHLLQLFQDEDEYLDNMPAQTPMHEQTRDFVVAPWAMDEEEVKPLSEPAQEETAEASLPQVQNVIMLTAPGERHSVQLSTVQEDEKKPDENNTDDAGQLIIVPAEFTKEEIAKAASTKDEAAATKIQATVRGKKVRKKKQEQIDAATKIQSRSRGKKVREQISDQHQAATKIQAFHRGHQIRKDASMTGLAHVMKHERNRNSAHRHSLEQQKSLKQFERMEVHMGR